MILYEFCESLEENPGIFCGLLDEFLRSVEWLLNDFCGLLDLEHKHKRI